VTKSLDLWEQGSEFHWLGSSGTWGGQKRNPWGKDFVAVGSGRDALRCLLRYGRTSLGWRRALIPSFLCQQIARVIVDEGFHVEAYFDDPREPINAPRPHSGDALLVVNTFGMRPQWRGQLTYNGAVIEDHTHDPWSSWAWDSKANYCIVSVRKTLPVPDGGIIWSPVKMPLPNAPVLTLAHHAAAAHKLEAMILKAMYLAECGIDKGTFRALAINGESGISTRDASAMLSVSIAVLNCFDTSAWREQRYANYRLVATRLADIAGVSVLVPQDHGSCPFSVVLACHKPSIRERLLKGLIERHIYPAILWPLENSVLELPDETVDLSKRILSLHCDGRYNERDMNRVADAVIEILSCPNS
jgi:hypothetical protein